MSIETTQKVVIAIVSELMGINSEELDMSSLLVRLFGGEFSHLWGEVPANIEIELGIDFAEKDIKLDTTLRQLIDIADQKRLVRT
jgi:hypothetical protein